MVELADGLDEVFRFVVISGFLFCCWKLCRGGVKLFLAGVIANSVVQQREALLNLQLTSLLVSFEKITLVAAQQSQQAAAARITCNMPLRKRFSTM